MPSAEVADILILPPIVPGCIPHPSIRIREYHRLTSGDRATAFRINHAYLVQQTVKSNGGYTVRTLYVDVMAYVGAEQSAACVR